MNGAAENNEPVGVQVTYTQVPNAILKGMSAMNMSALKVILAICRQTTGWHKEQDKISLSQLVKLTGMSRQGVLDGLEEGRKNKVIRRVEVTPGNPNCGFHYSVAVNNEIDYSQEWLVKWVNPVDKSTQWITKGQRNRPEPVKPVDTQKKEIKENEIKVMPNLRMIEAEINQIELDSFQGYGEPVSFEGQLQKETKQEDEHSCGTELEKPSPLVSNEISHANSSGVTGRLPQLRQAVNEVASVWDDNALILALAEICEINLNELEHWELAPVHEAVAWLEEQERTSGDVVWFGEVFRLLDGNPPLFESDPPTLQEITDSFCWERLGRVVGRCLQERTRFAYDICAQAYFMGYLEDRKAAGRGDAVYCQCGQVSHEPVEAIAMIGNKHELIWGCRNTGKPDNCGFRLPVDDTVDAPTWEEIQEHMRSVGVSD